MSDQPTLEQLADPWWRITSGALYHIMTKGDDGEPAVIPFVPNESQRAFLQKLHHRNLILKARQLGFTTLISIVWLDHALFVGDQRCGIVAHDREAAEAIFRDKIRFAYDRLPPMLRELMPLARDSATELLFAHNNSSIRVATSMRSGTIHRLHVSELGKIAKAYPEKAQEVLTGSIPAVPLSGVTVIESTAEGASGAFYELVQRAQEIQDTGQPLTQRDWRLHFFPWHANQGYAMRPDRVVIDERDRRYFQQLEAELGYPLRPEQQAWYVATRDADYPGNPELMWQEYPSTAEEAFQQSTEGCYYRTQLAQARIEGRVRSLPTVSEPVDTFWDVGRSDQTAIWCMQQVGPEYRMLRYYEASGEDLRHYVAWLQSTGYIWGTHYLPHDAAHKRLSDTNRSIEEMLVDLGLRNVVIVPRIDEINAGIQQTRAAMAQVWWDAEGCKQGLERLGAYRKRWNKTVGAWANEPLHDDNSNGSDAFRQFGQALAAGLLGRSGTVRRPVKRRSWRAA